MQKLLVSGLILSLLSHASAEPLSTIDAGSIAYDVGEADRYLAALTSGSIDTRAASEHAAMCIAGIRHVIANGVAADAAIEVAGVEMTLAAAIADHCQPLLDRAKQHGDRAKDQLVKRLKHLGLAGERLAFVLARHANQDDVYTTGGRLVRSDAEYLAPSVFFVLGGGGTGEYWSLTRFAFDGDHLASRTTQQYVRRPGVAKFR